MRPCTPAPQMVAITVVRPSEVAGGERGGGAGAVDGDLDQVHQRQRPAVRRVGEVDRLPCTVGRPLAAGLPGKLPLILMAVTAPSAQQGGALGVERPAGHVKASCGRGDRATLRRRQRNAASTAVDIVAVGHQPGDVGTREDEQAGVCHVALTAGRCWVAQRRACSIGWRGRTLPAPDGDHCGQHGHARDPGERPPAPATEAARPSSAMPSATSRGDGLRNQSARLTRSPARNAVPLPSTLSQNFQAAGGCCTAMSAVTTASSAAMPSSRNTTRSCTR